MTIHDIKIKTRKGAYLTAKEASDSIINSLNLYSNPRIIKVIIITY